MWCWPVERDFADRTTRVITEKAASFYAVRGVSRKCVIIRASQCSCRAEECPQSQPMMTSVHDNLS